MSLGISEGAETLNHLLETLEEKWRLVFHRPASVPFYGDEPSWARLGFRRVSAGWHLVVINAEGESMMLRKAPLDVRMNAVSRLRTLRTELDRAGKSFLAALEGAINDLRLLMVEVASDDADADSPPDRDP